MANIKRNEFKRKQEKRRKKRRRRKSVLLILFPILALLFFIGKNTNQSPKISNGIPLLLQTNSQWSEIPYGNSTIGISGCAPTCLSMVTSAKGNTEATPDKIAKFSEDNGYYVEGTGTKWTLMSDGAKEFGLKVKELALDENLIARELQNNHPIICSVGPGDFTIEGHFIVLTAYENGEIHVNDPNSAENSEKVWSYDRLAPQINAMWVYK